MFLRHRHLPSIKLFASHIVRNFLIGCFIIVFSLGLGMSGYSYFEEMNWEDSFLNASMILSGMGPVSPLNTEGGKLFAGCYALYSGIVFLLVIAIIIAPVFHRFLHHFFHKILTKDPK